LSFEAWQCFLPGGRSVAKILVADDNSNIQKMVGLALKDQGIEVVAVGNGEAAVRKISDIRPDLVLADVFMPVRNGYEVCRYVKEDSSLSHIPVILLVGAFDPLDEQEAQRSGADGVLKKPFVPPDPLISMVKSALVRAGVPLGNAPAAEKAPAAAKRSMADILNPASSKLAALSAEKLPEAVPEPVEEFPTPPTQVKIAAGSEPLAFGSLLGTPEVEEEPVITSKPMINLAEERNWDEEPDEVEEEKEEAEETEHGGWRPATLDEEAEPASAAPTVVPDWRDEAFHGNSPAEGFSKRWSPSAEQPKSVEAAESQAVAVSTIAMKPEQAPAPFTGDAWAAAMAAGVEEKLAAAKDIVTPVVDPEVLPPVREHLTQEVPELAAAVQDVRFVDATPVVEETQPAEPANWAVVPETAWEREAKKASLLASTWDAPKTPEPDVNETQDVPVYVPETPVAHVDDAHVVESGFYGGGTKALESSAHVETPVAAESSAAPALEASLPKSWANAWEAPVSAPAPAVAEAEPLHAVDHEPVAAATEQVTAADPAEANMDEIVARVLGKMNPEVLQRVTREILKPVIEAIVRDEINSKKS
jgi:CheY-like chemotaxis protein